MLPVGLVTPCPERVVGHNNQAGLSAELGRRRAADDFEGLNGVGRQLVGKTLLC